MKKMLALSLLAVWTVACASPQPGDGDDRQAPAMEMEEGPDPDKGTWVTIQGDLDGPATEGDWESATRESRVECGVNDIESSDLADELSTIIPRGEWTHRPEQRAGRCGDDYETILFRLTNCEREARGLEPLACDLRLGWSGRAHSKDMIERGYFDHVSPEGLNPGERLSQRGVSWRMTAENIAMTPTMALAHSGWMQSEGHRRNILMPEATHVGIGVMRSDRGYLMTAVFITE